MLWLRFFTEDEEWYPRAPIIKKTLSGIVALVYLPMFIMACIAIAEVRRGGGGGGGRNGERE